MQAVDAPVVLEHLKQLAELYRVKPPTNAVMKIWFERLKQFAVHDVADVLIEWPDRHSVMPTIDKVRAEVLDRSLRFEHGRKAREARDVMPTYKPLPQDMAAFAEFQARMLEIKASIPLHRRQPPRPLPWHMRTTTDPRTWSRPLTEADVEERAERLAIQAEATM